MNIHSLNRILNSRSFLRQCAVACAASAVLGVAPSAHAAISIDQAGSGVNSFTATPAVTEWSTMTWTGAATDMTDATTMDTAVGLLTAGSFTTTLPTSGTINNPGPSANAPARRNTAWNLLQMRPTGSVKGCVLMATLKNTSGSPISKLGIAYDCSRFDNNTTTAGEEVPGLRAYYSLTGLANSWVAINDLCVSPAGGSTNSVAPPTTAVSAVVDLTASPLAWNSTMYVLWADDDNSANGGADDANMIDNVNFTVNDYVPSANLLTFTWNGYTGLINQTSNTVALYVSHTTDVTTINPTCTMSAGASVSPASTANAGFTSSNKTVTYTVTAADSTQKNYTVTVYPVLAGPGEILPVPADLPVGAQYRLVFVTSTETYSGGSNHGSNPPWFTSVADYDAFATTTANAVPALAALATTWKAIISTRTPNSAARTNTATDPVANAATSVPIYQLGGRRVADGYADLWDGTIQNPINVNELGGGPVAQQGGVPHYTVWTGATADGQNAGAGNALINQDGGYISVGRADATDSSWIAGLDSVGVDPNARHTDAQPIYVMSGILTVPSPLSPDCNMVAFSWGGYTGVIDEGATPNPTVTVHVPYGTNLNPLDPNPTYAVSLGATCPKPNGGSGSLNFTSPQTYTVTAADGTHTKSYQASVIADIPTVTLGISASTVSEDGGTADVVATLSNAIPQDVTVNLSFSGTAVRGAQYTCNASITIPANETSAFVTLTGVQDNFYGPDRTVLVDISSVTNGLESGTQQVTATITNTTPQPAGLPYPSGINPTTGQPWQIGDQYQLVFVTSTTKSNNNLTIDPYNAFVNSVAASSTLPGIPNIQWYAIGTAGSDAATKPARVNALVSAPVYLVDGTTLVATGFTDMWDGSLANGINKDQNGAVVAANTQVWTGTYNSNGTPANFPTGPFYRTFNNDYSQYGLVGATDGTWITANESPAGSKRMYALSAPLTNTVPPPTILVTLGVDQTTIPEIAGQAVVTATLSQAAASDVTVNLSCTGTATLGTNYTASPGTSILIPAGQLSGTTTLTTVADGIYQANNKTIVVDIATVVNALEDGTQQVTVTITEGDSQPAGLPVPTGLNPGTGQLWKVGDTYHLAFVTSTTRNATNPNIATYNSFVNTAAGLSTLTDINHIQWFVIGSAQDDAVTAPAKVNAPVSGPVYLVDGATLVATGYADMWDGTLAHGIDKDQSGTAVAAGTAVWTGTPNADGTPANYPTGPFYRSLGSGVGYSQWGKVDATNLQWLNVGEAPSGSGYRLYALSVPLTCTVDSPPVAPLAPTITLITPNNNSLSVAFTAGYDGGSPITNYKVSTDDGVTFTEVSPATTASPIVISGLTNGTTYQVKILAVNSLGDGTPSAAVAGTPALPSSACDMLTYGPGADITGTNIVLRMPQGTTNEQVAALAPTFTLSPYANCNQPNGTTPPTPALSATGSVPYVVTAQDGVTSKTYHVTVVVLTMPNDNFADALTLAGGGGVSHSGVAGATLEAGEPDTYGYYANTVWFKWTAPSNGTLHLTTAGTKSSSGGEWDSTIDIYDGGPAIGALHSLLTADTGYVETVEQTVTAGTIYYIRIGWGGGPPLATDANGLVLTWSFVSSGGGGYGDWSTTYAGGQTPNLDYNNDGVANGIAYFMGVNGVATNPGIVDGKVTWPHVNAVTSFEVQVSDNLADWAPATSGVDTSDPTKVVYTLPTGATKKFCRLVVVP